MSHFLHPKTLSSFDANAFFKYEHTSRGEITFSVRFAKHYNFLSQYNQKNWSTQQQCRLNCMWAGTDQIVQLPMCWTAANTEEVIIMHILKLQRPKL